MVFLGSVVQPTKSGVPSSSDDFVESTVYGSRFAVQDIPRYEIPISGMPARTAKHLVRDELTLDGNPMLNLASFVTTYMEEEANDLIMENVSKNFIDYDEYPQTCEIHNRCVNMLARLFHAPMGSEDQEALGCSTVGSSEAIILATLAMKRKWQNARKAAGKDNSRPNLVMGANVQVCWEKAVRYLEIEERMVGCTADYLCMDPHKAVNLVDENTIGVVAILGSTYTGHYEDVKLLDELLEQKKLDVYIHVDAASGGFVAPFVNPDLVWDFRLPRVASINVSGHKYGLTYPGVGWALWRSPEFLPEELVFKIDYLGSAQASFTVNFSKNAFNIIAQYYVLIRFGMEGFKSIMCNLTKIADHLADALEQTGLFVMMSERGGRGLPLVAFRLKKSFKNFDEFEISRRLRAIGWIVPAYHMAPDVHELKMLRVVVREDFSMARCHKLIKDINGIMKAVEGSGDTSGTPEVVSNGQINKKPSIRGLFSTVTKILAARPKEQRTKGAVC